MFERLAVGIRRFGTWVRRRFGPRGAARVHDDADALGRAGERAAVRHLRRAGYRIVARRLRTRGGELDVVALDGPTLVLVEVKTTVAGAEAALGRVDARKRRRLRGAYAALARRPRLASRPRRCDVVTVVLGGRRPVCTLHRAFAPLGGPSR